MDFIPPARATVDFGRDTKALLEIVRTGAMSTRRFAEMHGLDEEAEEDAAIAAAVRRKTKCEAVGLSVTDVFPPAPGSPAPMQPAPRPEEHDEEYEETEVVPPEEESR